MDRPRRANSLRVGHNALSARLAGAAKRMNPPPKFGAFCTNT